MKRKRAQFSLAQERDGRIIRAFDALACMGFQVVHVEEKPQERKPHPPRHDLRIAPAEHAQLRDMASRAVWQEIGGRAIRETGEYQTGGRVIGRTVWSGMPEWAQGLGMNKASIENAVEKAIAGNALGARQARCLRIMLAEIRGEDLSAIPEGQETGM